MQLSENKYIKPYKDETTNLIYNLLFCDNFYLFKEQINKDIKYPFDVLFSEKSKNFDFQEIIDNINTESRVKILAYNKQLQNGFSPLKKELLAVIVEVGLENGLDVLASYQDGSARYINQSGQIVVWETTNEISNQLTNDLFTNSQEIVNEIGVWDKPRKPNPTTGNMRITFLVSDGIYFGEGPINALFNDALANPTLTSATKLMQYLIHFSE